MSFVLSKQQIFGFCLIVLSLHSLYRLMYDDATMAKHGTHPNIPKNYSSSSSSSSLPSVTPTIDTELSRHTINITISQKQIHKHLRQFFERNYIPLCHDVMQQYHHHWNSSSSNTTITTDAFNIRYHYQFHCEEMYTGGRGTGNWLWFIYSIRQAAYQIGNIEMDMKCDDVETNQSSLIVPWLMGTFAANDSSGIQQAQWDTICQPTWEMKDRVLQDIRYELRRMAISLIGIPYPGHSASQFTIDPVREKQLQVPTLIHSPLLMNHTIEIDDVAIHFRCGDLLEKKHGPDYGYAKFTSLVQFISHEACTIGIITQPMQGQIRINDRKDTGRCGILVGALQSFLQSHFPQSKVTIRNSSDETISLAFTRFIMANQTIAAGTSTFIAMPFYATFGTAYQVDRNEMIDNSQIYDLWSVPNGQQQILDLLTDNTTMQ